MVQELVYLAVFSKICIQEPLVHLEADSIKALDMFVGYSLCTLPNSPGCHHLSCPVWRPLEARRSFGQELTSWLTGLSPQLVDEAFITGIEQRYEQGQHLHSQGCSSGLCGRAAVPALAPAGHSMEVIWETAAACGANSGSVLLQEAYSRPCRSFSASGAGGGLPAGPAGLAGSMAGGRICLRLHLLARGLSQLRHSDGTSVGRCLERLHNSVEQIRRCQGRQKATELQEDYESEGVRLVREGRPARLTALIQQQQQQQGPRRRDQQQLQDGDGHPACATTVDDSAGRYVSPMVSGGTQGTSRQVQQGRDNSSAAAAGGGWIEGSDRAGGSNSSRNRLTGRHTGRATAAGHSSSPINSRMAPARSSRPMTDSSPGPGRRTAASSGSHAVSTRGQTTASNDIQPSGPEHLGSSAQAGTALLLPAGVRRSLD
eukprot:gene5580-5818_t